MNNDKWSFILVLSICASILIGFVWGKKTGDYDCRALIEKEKNELLQRLVDDNERLLECNEEIILQTFTLMAVLHHKPLRKATEIAMKWENQDTTSSH
ncbi:MAG: hypothetical protein ACOC90_04665 [Bacteroidota bacterium]